MVTLEDLVSAHLDIKPYVNVHNDLLDVILISTCNQLVHHSVKQKMNPSTIVQNHSEFQCGCLKGFIPKLYVELGCHIKFRSSNSIDSDETIRKNCLSSLLDI